MIKSDSSFVYIVGSSTAFILFDTLLASNKMKNKVLGIFMLNAKLVFGKQSLSFQNIFL